MKNYGESVEMNDSPNWPYIPDHLFRILIINGLGSGKINVLLYLMKHKRPSIDKTYIFVTDLLESKYQLLISGREKVGTEKLKDLKTLTFIESSQTIDVYENLEDYNPTKKRKVVIVFDDMISLNCY